VSTLCNDYFEMERNGERQKLPGQRQKCGRSRRGMSFGLGWGRPANLSLHFYQGRMFERSTEILAISWKVRCVLVAFILGLGGYGVTLTKKDLGIAVVFFYFTYMSCIAALCHICTAYVLAGHERRHAVVNSTEAGTGHNVASGGGSACSHSTRGRAGSKVTPAHAPQKPPAAPDD